MNSVAVTRLLPRHYALDPPDAESCAQVRVSDQLLVVTDSRSGSRETVRPASFIAGGLSSEMEVKLFGCQIAENMVRMAVQSWCNIEVRYRFVVLAKTGYEAAGGYRTRSNTF